MNMEGWQHRASISRKLGLAIGILGPEAGPTLCRLPNVPGMAALAEEDWFDGDQARFSYQGKTR